VESSAASPDGPFGVSPPSPVEREVRRVHELLRESRHAEALAPTQALVRLVPQNRDALYLLAVTQRALSHIDESLKALETLEKYHPRFSRLFEERGYCYVALRDAPGAIRALLQAVNINPALPGAWSVLQGLYLLAGDTRNAATAQEHVSKLKQLAPQVVQATALYSDGDLTLAENIIRPYLRQNGDDVDGMRILAKIAIAREIFDDAELLLESALRLAPHFRAARYDYALVLIERHRFQQAIRELESFLESEPEHRQGRTLKATALVGLGEHQKAIDIYRQLIVDATPPADLHLSIAHALKTIGKLGEAIEAYRVAAADRPGNGEAYWSLANLKTYSFPETELGSMLAEQAKPDLGAVDRYHLCFALGKAFEDRCEFADSWHFYERGNGLKRAELHYDPALIETNTQQQIEICTQEFFGARRNWGSASNEPIFIIGMPRSGSTLIEQILASHSQVEGTHELAEIPRIAHELQGRESDRSAPRYPRVLAQMAESDFERFAERYLQDTRAYRASNKPRFIDKMPNNFRHLGLIHLMLPNAKIIDARREPMACCFSNLKQLFARGQEFTYSIEDISRYYRTYLELMEHWNRVLPGRILRIQHESVVDDLEATVRRILDFCELDFEPACVEFYKTPRSVRTASSEQVRQPIFRDGLDQWTHYRPWLAPLEAALGDALCRYRE
jgi:tetratricopeptide (TPR) repeat protein